MQDSNWDSRIVGITSRMLILSCSGLFGHPKCFNFFLQKWIWSRDMPIPETPIFTLIQLGFPPNFKGFVLKRKIDATKERSPLSVVHCNSSISLLDFPVIQNFPWSPSTTAASGFLSPPLSSPSSCSRWYPSPLSIKFGSHSS